MLYPRSVSPSSTVPHSSQPHPRPHIVTLRPSTSIQVLQQRDDAQKKEEAAQELRSLRHENTNDLHLHSMKYENHQIMTVTQMLLSRRQEKAKLNELNKHKSPRIPFVTSSPSSSSSRTPTDTNKPPPFRIVDAIKEGKLEIKKYQKLLDVTVENSEASLAALKSSMDESSTKNTNISASVVVVVPKPSISLSAAGPIIPPLPLSSMLSSSTVASSVVTSSSKGGTKTPSVTPFRAAVQDASEFQHRTFSQLRETLPSSSSFSPSSHSFSEHGPSKAHSSSSLSSVRRKSIESISGFTLNVSRFEHNPIPNTAALLPENIVKKIGNTKMTLKMLKEHYVYPFNIRGLTMDSSSTIPKEDKKLYRIKMTAEDTVHPTGESPTSPTDRNNNVSPTGKDESPRSVSPSHAPSSPSRSSRHPTQDHSYIANPNTISLKASSNEIKSRLKDVLEESYGNSLLKALSTADSVPTGRTVPSLSDTASLAPSSVSVVKSRYGGGTSSIFGGGSTTVSARTTVTTSPRDRTVLYEDEDSDSEEQQRKRAQILKWYTTMNDTVASSSSSDTFTPTVPPPSLQSVALQPHYIDIQFGASQDLCDRRIIERYLESAYEIFTDPGPPPPLILSEPQLNNLLHDCVHKFPLELLVHSPTETSNENQKKEEQLRALILLTSVPVTRLAVGLCHLIYWTLLRNYYMDHSSLLYDLRRTLYNHYRLEQERLFRRLSLLQGKTTDTTAEEERNGEEYHSVTVPNNKSPGQPNKKQHATVPEKKETAVSNSRGSQVMRRLSTILRSIQETEEEKEEARKTNVQPINSNDTTATVPSPSTSLELPSLSTLLDIPIDDWDAPVPDTQLLITAILQESSHIDDIFKGTVKLPYSPPSGSPNLYYLRSVVLLCVKIVTEAYLRSRYGYHFLLETALAEYSRRFLRHKTKESETEPHKKTDIILPSQIVSSLVMVPPVHMQIDSLVAELLDPGRLANHLPLLESNIHTRSVLRKNKVELKRLNFLNRAEKSKNIQKLHKTVSPSKPSAASSSTVRIIPGSPTASIASLVPSYTVDSLSMTESGSNFDHPSPQRPSPVSLAQRANTLGEKFTKSVYPESSALLFPRNEQSSSSSSSVIENKESKNTPVPDSLEISSSSSPEKRNTLPLLYYPSTSKDLLCTTSSHIRALVPHPQDPITRKFLAHSMNYLQTTPSNSSHNPVPHDSAAVKENTKVLPVSPMQPSSTLNTSVNPSTLINAQGSIAINSPLARTALTRMSYERAAHRYRVREGGVDSIQRLQILEDLIRHEEQAVETSRTLRPLTSPSPGGNSRPAMTNILQATRLDTVLNSSWQNNNVYTYEPNVSLNYTPRNFTSTVQPLDEERKHDFPTDEPFTYDEETEPRNVLTASSRMEDNHPSEDSFKNMKYMAIYEKRSQNEDTPKSAETVLLHFLKHHPVGPYTGPLEDELLP